MREWSPEVLRHGKDEPLPEAHTLRAGPLSVLHEGADLRYARLGQREVLRRIYVAVRDDVWGTILPSVSNTRMEEREDSFLISFDAEHKRGAVDFAWQGTIEGRADGTVRFSMEGVARSTFMSARIGICVLHPIRECAGRPCTVEHVDGTTTQGAFPRLVSPDRPFMDVRAVTHEVTPSVRAEVRFAGEVFEMEDQRNWTDGSYKTYSATPGLPSPAKIKKGTVVSQSVMLSLKGKPRRRRAKQRAVTLTLAKRATAAIPRIGLGAASHAQPIDPEQLDRLKALNLSHLRVDLRLYAHGHQEALRCAWVEAEALGVGLEAVVFLSDAAEDELKALRESLEALRPTVRTWLVFHKDGSSTSGKWVEIARRHLCPYDTAARIGAGTNGHFAQLNRRRPPLDAVDLVSFSMSPQVHAFDNRSLVEALQGQAWTIESARHFIGHLPLAVGPITLRPRSSPAGRHGSGQPADELPPQVDERQVSLFGAGWTAGSLKHLLQGGVCSATYYETTGWRGVVETLDGSPMPEMFRSLPGCVFPLYHVLADVAEFAGGKAVRTTSSHPLDMDGLAVRKGAKTRVVLANFGPVSRPVRINNVSGTVRIRQLDATNAEVAMLRPEEFRSHDGEPAEATAGSLELDLLPYAVARIDMGEDGGA